MRAALHRHQALYCALISFSSIALFWQLAVDFGLIKPFFVSTPVLVAQELWRQACSGELARNAGVSLYEFFAGLVLAVSIGAVVGLLASWSRTIEHIVEPFVWFKYSSPTIAFYPMFVAWLGLGEPTIIAITFLFAVTPVYANTLAGIKNTDPDLVRAAKAFGGNRMDIFVKVSLPGSVPMMVAGLRLAVGRAMTGVVAAELFGATAGLGFSIAYYGQKLKTSPMMASLIVVVALGAVFTQALSLIEAKVDSWRTGPGR